ncbi:uncharacterized protein SETTUDRAFT_37942 [Exserohilum turcica Et28A]|uniref:Uncharacterized protein n=1 Tax=Exserohilum turcicum (strain 28A) TaxID=671987 RepID=R0IXY1_EXST2|nr:uncharacterized protein SETTUDRAFT_37942 [Exserohilum turcica Et28A]EOA89431.1 hypothetical protein SETTUDRAFT_37942 [Exserohilum turcica Et28A]
MHDQGPRTLKPPRRRRKKTPRPTTVPSRLVPTHPDPPALTSHDEPGPGGCCTRGFKRTSPALPAASALFASLLDPQPTYIQGKEHGASGTRGCSTRDGGKRRYRSDAACQLGK